MAINIKLLHVLSMLLINLLILCAILEVPGAMSSAEGYGDDMGGFSGGVDLYNYACPEAEAIVFSGVEKAVMDDSRMAASLLRLHFHDCFVNVCQLLNNLPVRSRRYSSCFSI